MDEELENKEDGGAESVEVTLRRLRRKREDLRKAHQRELREFECQKSRWSNWKALWVEMFSFLSSH